MAMTEQSLTRCYRSEGLDDLQMAAKQWAFLAAQLPTARLAERGREPDTYGGELALHLETRARLREWAPQTLL